MQPNEETPTLKDIQAADRTARQALVTNEANNALARAKCSHPDLLLPHVVEKLKTINIGEGDGFKVFAVDQRTGIVRLGANGELGPDDAVAEVLHEHQTWRRFFPPTR